MKVGKEPHAFEFWYCTAQIINANWAIYLSCSFIQIYLFVFIFLSCSPPWIKFKIQFNSRFQSLT